MAKGIKGSSPTEDIPVRTSFNIKPSITKNLKRIALEDNTNQTAILETALSEFIAKWEKKHPDIKL